MGHIEDLARQDLREAVVDPCQIWDTLVEMRMQQDGVSRSVAVDRCLSTHQGSAAWQACCSWDSAQPKTIEQNGRQIKSGNWLNANPGGVARRIPRAP